MTTIDWSQCRAVESVPGRLSGAWVFRDTRMPVSAVFENLEAGATIDEIIDQFGHHAGADSGRARICRPQPGRAPRSCWRGALIDAHSF